MLYSSYKEFVSPETLLSDQYSTTHGRGLPASCMMEILKTFAALQGNPDSDANPFLKAALTAKWRKNVVLSPHIYPPSITKQAMSGASGVGLYDRLTRSFGAYTKQVM